MALRLEHLLEKVVVAEAVELAWDQVVQRNKKHRQQKKLKRYISLYP
jgi:hypothetical protein